MDTRRVTLFDSPLFLGFEHFEKTFDRMQKSGGEGYPPYNIEQIGDAGFQITLAVAGFSMNDLDVEIEQNQLTIRGKQSETENGEERIFLHRGIATRQFKRSFILADGIEVRGAALDNGLLHIALKRTAPESTAKKIKIQTPSSLTPIPQAINIDEKEGQTADTAKKTKKESR